MPEAKTVPAPSINLLDESFDPKKSGSYHLSILANDCSDPTALRPSQGSGEGLRQSASQRREGRNQNSTLTLAFAVLDTHTNRYVVLQSLTHSLEEDALAPFRAGGNGGLSFLSVTCAVAHPKFTLIPSALFDEENKELLLGFNHPVQSDEKIHSDTVRSLNAKNLFTINREFETLIRKQFPNAHFLHSSTAFIEGLLAQNKHKAGKKVFANFYASHFEVVILEGSELLFSNAFNYKTPEEIAYFILFVYEQLHLNPEETELVLSGEIEKTAKEHALLYNYIRHVKFAALPDLFKYSYKFDEIQGHRFFSLFNQYLIAN